MPLYSYACPECGAEFDQIHTVDECNDPQWCDCGYLAIRVIRLGHGGIQRSDSEWVKSVAQVFERPDIQTIGDLRKFYKEHPNIRPNESHPALPSSIGDVKKPDTARETAERNKRAREYIRKRRAITIQSAGQAA